MANAVLSALAASGQNFGAAFAAAVLANSAVSGTYPFSSSLGLLASASGSGLRNARASASLSAIADTSVGSTEFSVALSDQLQVTAITSASAARTRFVTASLSVVHSRSATLRANFSLTASLQVTHSGITTIESVVVDVSVPPDIRISSVAAASLAASVPVSLRSCPVAASSRDSAGAMP